MNSSGIQNGQQNGISSNRQRHKTVKFPAVDTRIFDKQLKMDLKIMDEIQKELPQIDDQDGYPSQQFIKKTSVSKKNSQVNSVAQSNIKNVQQTNENSQQHDILQKARSRINDLAQQYQINKNNNVRQQSNNINNNQEQAQNFPNINDDKYTEKLTQIQQTDQLQQYTQRQMDQLSKKMARNASLNAQSPFQNQIFNRLQEELQEAQQNTNQSNQQYQAILREQLNELTMQDLQNETNMTAKILQLTEQQQALYQQTVDLAMNLQQQKDAGMQALIAQQQLMQMQLEQGQNQNNSENIQSSNVVQSQSSDKRIQKQEKQQNDSKKSQNKSVNKQDCHSSHSCQKYNDQNNKQEAQSIDLENENLNWVEDQSDSEPEIRQLTVTRTGGQAHQSKSPIHRQQEVKKVPDVHNDIVSGNLQTIMTSGVGLSVQNTQQQQFTTVDAKHIPVKQNQMEQEKSLDDLIKEFTNYTYIRNTVPGRPSIFHGQDGTQVAYMDQYSSTVQLQFMTKRETLFSESNEAKYPASPIVSQKIVRPLIHQKLKQSKKPLLNLKNTKVQQITKKQ